MIIACPKELFKSHEQAIFTNNTPASSCIKYGRRGIIAIAKKSVRISRQLTQKRIPRECQLPGDSLCLLTLALTVKPLANVKASYTCYDSQKEIGENFQDAHLLSVARLEKGSLVILPYFVKFEKHLNPAYGDLLYFL